MNVKVMNEGIALVNAMYSRIDKSDTNYFTGAAMYSFRKIDKNGRFSQLHHLNHTIIFGLNRL